MATLASPSTCAGTYLFIGERPSPRAAAQNWTWDDGHLCARTLLDALDAAGIDRQACAFVNLWSTPGIGPLDDALHLTPIIEACAHGTTIVALGRLVQRALRRAGVPHRRLIHPAARGAIRRRAAYHAHVRAVLGSSAGVTR